MSVRLLLLDNAVHRVLLRPPWHWNTHLRGVARTVINVPSGRRIPPVAEHTHLLVTGSEASILDPKPWFEREAAAIREAAACGLPILGSCFGHQMLVYALSGSQHLRRCVKPEIGWVALQFLHRDDLFVSTPNPWHTFTVHFDEVADPPPPWRVLARSADCATHILRYGDRPIWGIQAHPELSLAKARLFLGAYLLVSGRDRRRTLLAMRAPSREDRITGDLVRRFLACDSAPPQASG